MLWKYCYDYERVVKDLVNEIMDKKLVEKKKRLMDLRLERRLKIMKLEKKVLDKMKSVK